MCIMAKTLDYILTGATGGLGRAFVDYVNDKDSILALGRNEVIGASLNANFKKCDLSNLDEVLNVFSKANCLIHSAALSSAWGSLDEFYKHNVLATSNIIKAAKEHGIKKLIFISSPSIYFDYTNRFNIKEDLVIKKFASLYTYTKFLAEHLVLTSGLKYVILRPRGIFGEYDNVLLPRLKKLNFMPLVNDDVICDITYSANVAHAIYLASKCDENLVFNITNDESLKLKDIYTLIQDILEPNLKIKKVNQKALKIFANTSELLAKAKLIKEPLITNYTLGLISYSQTLDISKAKEILGYEPIYSIKDGLLKCKAK